MAPIIYGYLLYFLQLEKVSELINKSHEKYITCVVLLNILNNLAIPLSKKKLRQQEEFRNK